MLDEGSSSVVDAFAAGRAFRRKEVAMDDCAVERREGSCWVVEPAKEESDGMEETGLEGVFSRRGAVLRRRVARTRGVLVMADRRVRGEKTDMVMGTG